MEYQTCLQEITNPLTGLKYFIEIWIKIFFFFFVINFLIYIKNSQEKGIKVNENNEILYSIAVLDNDL